MNLLQLLMQLLTYVSHFLTYWCVLVVPTVKWFHLRLDFHSSLPIIKQINRASSRPYPCIGDRDNIKAGIPLRHVYALWQRYRFYERGSALGPRGAESLRSFSLQGSFKIKTQWFIRHISTVCRYQPVRSISSEPSALPLGLILAESCIEFRLVNWLYKWHRCNFGSSQMQTEYPNRSPCLGSIQPSDFDHFLSTHLGVGNWWFFNPS